jgi:thiol-disulfide isomerase/thioredoxin
MIARMALRAGIAAFALGLAAVAGGCGAEVGPGNPASKATDYERALAGAPPPLADLYDHGNELLPGGLAAYEKRLEELRGHPVVVNKWASWCGPCRAEFPFFQSLAARHGKRVAFLGVDADDSDDAARTFLRELPLPYPSYSDPDLEISDEIGAEAEFPATAFYDAGGELVYLHRGGYQDQADLAADIDRYALSAAAPAREPRQGG